LWKCRKPLKITKNEPINLLLLEGIIGSLSKKSIEFKTYKKLKILQE
jgi:hypothetical protein